ncbi:sporulation protein [Bacillus sp. FJAT-45066]|uniref:sporulation protein n=1 Tax=Bacillus sp. FJAT-45066 TaxID=2011010 RepID=UPI000BB71E9D|nr:sporulation protein [Bacillus sp. FJAT-45066]
MNKPIAYLREILEHYADNQQIPREIMSKLENESFQRERDFVLTLNEHEIEFLNNVLPNEINHAMEAEDFPRVQQLNEVYELL